LKGASAELSMIVDAFVTAALAAGDAIAAVAAKGVAATTKPDGSPVTGADLAAEAAIRDALGEALPHLPIIGEEGERPAAKTLPRSFILVDPLDGTRDFLKGSREFTVNIALIRDGRPAAGVVHAPALGRLFAGSADGGAFELSLETAGALAAQQPGEARARRSPRRAIKVREVPASGPVSLESRSHPDAATRALVDKLAPASRRQIASSLKFGLIAAGEGDLYARAVALNEWDIAAGDAVLSAAGGAVLAHTGEPLRYGAPALKAEPFIAIGDPRLRGRVLALRGGAGL
jgi:3'(2'), 5'-bisphosphate nucleotidase